MKKILALVLCFCMLSVSAGAMSIEMQMGKNTVSSFKPEDGHVIKQQEIEVAPFTVNDRTMVPVRVIAESFGAQVGWEEAAQTVTVSVPGKEIVLVLGSSEVYVNGESVTLDVAAMEQNGRTLVPLRFITETFGYTVKYLPSTQQIYITDSPVVMRSKHSVVTLEEVKLLYDLMYEKMIPTPESGATEAEIAKLEKQLIDAIALFYMQSLPLYDALIYEQGGFSAEAVNAIQDEVSMFEPYDVVYGALPSVYAFTWEMMSALIEISSKAEALISAEELQKIYEEYYWCAKHILIPTVDLQSGAALSEEEVLAAQKLAQDLCAQLADGADFDALMQEYSQDGGLEANPDGYVFTAGEMVDEFYNGTIALQVGEISAPVQSMFGYHIIKRMPLPAMGVEQYELCKTIAIGVWAQNVLAKNPTALLMPSEQLVEYLK